MGLVSIDIGATLHRAFLKAQRERKYHVAVANDRRSATHRAFYDVLPSKGCHHATGQLEVSLDYAVLGKDGDEAEPGTPAKASAASNKLCGIQPLVWVVLTKLENSLARSNRSRFGRFLDESIALVEFSKHSRRDCVETFAYAHIEVGLKI